MAKKRLISALNSPTGSMKTQRRLGSATEGRSTPERASLLDRSLWNGRPLLKCMTRQMAASRLKSADRIAGRESRGTAREKV